MFGSVTARRATRASKHKRRRGMAGLRGLGQASGGWEWFQLWRGPPGYRFTGWFFADYPTASMIWQAQRTRPPFVLTQGRREWWGPESDFGFHWRPYALGQRHPGFAIGTGGERWIYSDEHVANHVLTLMGKTMQPGPLDNGIVRNRQGYNIS